MTGSTLDLIVIAVVVVILLAAGIVLVFYADAHPAWRRPETPRRARHIRPGGSPARRTAGTQPGRRAPRDADVTAGKRHRSARRDLARREADCGGKGTGTGGPELTTQLR